MLVQPRTNSRVRYRDRIRISRAALCTYGGRRPSHPYALSNPHSLSQKKKEEKAQKQKQKEEDEAPPPAPLEPAVPRHVKRQVPPALPYTLHATRYTLHRPAPYTLHPIPPYNLHLTPCTPHPTPYTLHPTPYTLHSTPYTLQHTPPPAPLEPAVPRHVKRQVLPALGDTAPCEMTGVTSHGVVSPELFRLIERLR